MPPRGLVGRGRRRDPVQGRRIQPRLHRDILRRNHNHRRGTHGRAADQGAQRATERSRKRQLQLPAHRPRCRRPRHVDDRDAQRAAGAIGWETISSAELTGSGHVDVTKAFTGGTFAYLEGAGQHRDRAGRERDVSSWLGIQEEHKLENAGTLTISEGASINGSSTGGLINTGTPPRSTEGTGTATIAAADRQRRDRERSPLARLNSPAGAAPANTTPTRWATTDGAKIVFNNQKAFALGIIRRHSPAASKSPKDSDAGTVEGPSAAVTLERQPMGTARNPRSQRGNTVHAGHTHAERRWHRGPRQLWPSANAFASDGWRLAIRNRRARTASQAPQAPCRM